MQHVRVPYRLTLEERRRFLEKDLDDMAGLKDTSREGIDADMDMIELAPKIPEPVCECCGGPDPDYMDETLGLVCEGCSQMLGSAK
jgi:hypothetical protein